MEGKENNDDFLSNGEWKGKFLAQAENLHLPGMVCKDVV